MTTKGQGTTFGASIVPTITNDAPHPSAPMLDSPSLTPAITRDEADYDYASPNVPIHSPFYQHPPVSFERVHSRQTSKSELGVASRDVEKGAITPLSTDEETNPFTARIGVDCNKEDKMWPSKQTLISHRMAEKKKRRMAKSCGGFGPVRDFWARFDKRQKLLIKIAIAVFLVGVAVAIGVGISVAVHGTVYGVHNGQQQVGQGS